MIRRIPLFITILLTLCEIFSAISSPSDLQTQIDLHDRNTSEAIHSRRRRYVVFPEGTSFQVSFSLKRVIGVDSLNIFTEGLNYGLSYDLPDEPLDKLEESPARPMRRQKRELYKRVEILLDLAGLDGRNCLLQTICETAQLIRPREGVLQEIVRLIFTYPIMNSTSSLRGGSYLEYVNAHMEGVSSSNCAQLFHCPISILQLLLQFGIKSNNNY